MKQAMQRALATLKRGKLKGLRSGITWEAYTGLGGDCGDTPAYGTATTLSAHLIHGERKLMNSAGQEVLSSATLIIPENIDMNINDRLTLPDGTTPQIVKVDKLVFGGVAYAVEVYLGRYE